MLMTLFAGVGGDTAPAFLLDPARPARSLGNAQSTAYSTYPRPGSQQQPASATRVCPLSGHRRELAGRPSAASG